MKPNIEISDKNLKQIAGLLNILLADEYVLYTKTRNAHWNITGQSFMELHSFFQSQYESLDKIIDALAERVRMLGQQALGSLRDFLTVTTLVEDELDFSNQKLILKALTADHESIVRSIRNEISPVAGQHNDLATTDFVTGLIEKHEKMAWMLRSYIS